LQEFITKSGLTGVCIPGTKLPIGFIHGMWGGAWQWENWMGLAAASGHTASAINLRGHHGSRGIRKAHVGKVSIQEFIEDADEFIDNIGGPCAIVGHSMGGFIGQCVASHPRVKKAVFVTSAPPPGFFLGWHTTQRVLRSPSSVWKMLRHQPFAMPRKHIDFLAFNNVEESKRDDLYNRCVPESGKAGLQIVLGQAFLNGLKVPPVTSCPTMVVGGELDRLTPLSLQLKIAGYHGSAFKQYPNSHMIMLERHWRRPMLDILSFINF
jgi:pimeloyl-ACP methyl ester carboxylesterase